jgi:hypothetical protein
MFFNGMKTEEDINKKGDVIKVCVCLCGARIKYVNNGYQNFMTHLKCRHTNYHEEYLRLCDIKRANPVISNADLSRYLVSAEAKNVYNWLRFIIMNNLAFQKVEQASILEFVSMEKISLTKFMECLRAVAKEHCKEIKKRLSKGNFGLLFDGWGKTETPYMGIFAYVIDTNEYLLLAIAPLLDEEDYSAHEHAEFIQATLNWYGRSIDDVLFFVGDNCNVNKRLATHLSVPLVGCASHRLNLAVKEIHSEMKEIIDKINAFMVKWKKSLKLGGWFRKRTTLRPKTANKTRWLSTYVMVKRYLKLKDIIDSADFPASYESYRLSEEEVEEISTLLSTKMGDLHSVAVELQDQALTIKHVRDLFDALIASYPTCPHLRKYCTADASIVAAPNFESAILKLQTGQHDSTLSRAEKDTLTKFKKVRTPPSNAGNQAGEQQARGATFAQRVLGKRTADGVSTATANAIESPAPTLSRRISQHEGSQYIDCTRIPATSCIVERLFSKAGLVLNQRRKSMSPLHFEAAMMLQCNSNLWDVKTVVNALSNMRESRRASRTDTAAGVNIDITQPLLHDGGGTADEDDEDDDDYAPPIYDSDEDDEDIEAVMNETFGDSGRRN